MLRTRITTAVGLAIAVCLATVENSAGRAASPAAVSFHFMQIEQVIGGVNGDPSAQAIQLRMRTCFQNQVQQARLVAESPLTGLTDMSLIPVSL